MKDGNFNEAFQSEEFKQFMFEPDASKWPPVRPEWRQAKLVFDHMMAVPEIDDTEESLKKYRVHHEKLDRLISENLNHETILQFAVLCAETHAAARALMLAEARLAKDPKQADKKGVRECWELWQADKRRYKSKAAFAKDMLDKFEQLESQRVIERWCKEWESEPS